jgi:serine/threonine protein kinase
MPSLTGSTFHDRYEVVRNISTGGMGSVYEAIHVETHRRCALKVMLPSLVRDAEMLARFRLECTVASNFDSEHIVQVLDAGVDAKSGLPFLVMELLQGQELFTVLEERGALSAQEVVTYLHQVALALEKTHAAGVIHRDLKPENLFLTTRDDGSPRVKDRHLEAEPERSLLRSRPRQVRPVNRRSALSAQRAPRAAGTPAPGGRAPAT